VEEVAKVKRETKKNVPVLRPKGILKLTHGKAREREKEREAASNFFLLDGKQCFFCLPFYFSNFFHK
jgi:hypothetical protein